MTLKYYENEDASQNMNRLFNRKLAISFLVIILMALAYGYRPVFPTYLYLKFSPSVNESSYLYLNGNERIPLIGSKDIEDNNLVKFGPIKENIKSIRIDPIYNKNISVEIEEIYIKNQFGKVYEYSINNFNKWVFYNIEKKDVKKIRGSI